MDRTDTYASTVLVGLLVVIVLIVIARLATDGHIDGWW